MVRIDSFYVGRDDYGNGHYVKVRLVDGNTYFLKYLGYDEHWCSHFYRWPNLIKPPYHFLLTRKKHYDSMKDTRLGISYLGLKKRCFVINLT